MAPPLRVIPNLDLERELQTIDKFLRDGHYRQVGQLCGVILESALKETYRQILLEAPPETRKILGDLETKLGQGKTDYRSFELGKLVGLFREGNLFALGQKPLAIDCRISKDRLAKLVDWRNACAHPDHPVPSVAELNSFYWDLILLLQGLHFIPPRAAPPEAVRQSQEGPRHVAPGSLSLGDLAVWEEALGRGRLDMSLDCRQDGYLRDLQRILKEVLARSGYTRASVDDCGVALIEMGVNVARHASDPVARLTIEISPKVHRCIIEMRSAGTPVLLEEALHKHSDGKIHGIENIFRRGRVKMGRAGDLILVSYDQRLARLRREVPRAEILSRKTDPRPGIPFSSEEIPEGCLAVIGEQEGEIFIIDRSFDRGRWQKSLSLSEWPRLDAGMDLIFYAFAEFGKLGKELVFPGELAAWRKRWPLDQGGGKMPEGAGEVAKRLVSRAGPEDKGQVNSENLKEIAEMDFSASPEVLTHRKNALRFFSESVVRILRERTGSPKSPIIAFQGRLPAGGEESRSEWHDDIITNYTSGPGDHEPHWLAKLVLYLEDQGFVVVRSREEYLRATEGWFARWGRRALGWFRQ